MTGRVQEEVDDVAALDHTPLSPDGPEAHDDTDGTDGTDSGVAATGIARGTGLAIAVWAAVGLAAAFTLAVERVRLLENPSEKLSCDLSPILSCGSVMVTEQARAFGFPNPFLGIGAFAVALTIGVLLAGRVVLPRWVLDGLAAGALLGLGFVVWLIAHSMFSIGALCPWCMVVWAVTIPTAVWSVLLAARAHRPASAGLELAWDLRYLIVLGLYLVVVVLALVQFWTYWETLL